MWDSVGKPDDVPARGFLLMEQLTDYIYRDRSYKLQPSKSNLLVLRSDSCIPLVSYMTD